MRSGQNHLQGKAKVERRQGRQRKRREDNIREWTGLEFTKSQRAVENREKWRKLVVKSSVVPQRPPRLRDCEGEGDTSASGTTSIDTADTTNTALQLLLRLLLLLLLLDDSFRAL